MDGSGPGDRIIIFTGAILAPGQRPTETMYRLNASVGVKGAGVTMFNTPYFNILKAQDIMNQAIKIVVDAKKADPNATIIVFGYSYGGVQAQNLSRELKKLNIDVKLLVTLDAANGKFDVNRKITDNVEMNDNYFQKNVPEGIIERAIDSKGDANTADDSNKTDVNNKDKTDETYNGKPVDHYSIDDAYIMEIINRINETEPGEVQPKPEQKAPAPTSVPTTRTF